MFQEMCCALSRLEFLDHEYFARLGTHSYRDGITHNRMFPERGNAMKSSSTMAMRLAMLALCTMLTGAAMAQESAPTAPPLATANPADPTAPTTALTQPSGTMSKSQIKDQRQQQKRDEAAARANTKAAKAQASLLHADAKSKDANDKALQAQEKAGQVTAVPQVAPAAPATTPAATNDALPPPTTP